MIDSIKALEEYLKLNKMQSTLEIFRAQIQNKYPQGPSNQLMALAEETSHKKNLGKTLELSARISQKSMISKNSKKKDDRIMQSLLGKIAYSSNILEDQKMEKQIKLLGENKLFQKMMKNSEFINPNQYYQMNFEENKGISNTHKIFGREEPEDKISLERQVLANSKQSFMNQFIQYQDELDLVQSPNQIQGTNQKDQDDSNNNFRRQNNVISKIDLDGSEISIVSQPSFVLEELNRQQYTNQGYTDDNDLGYFQYTFQQHQLIMGCSKLTLKYGYPQRAIKKNSKQKIVTKKISPKSPKNRTKKFPQGVIFPNSNDQLYPIEFNNIIYDSLKLKVIFDREKTGYEETKDLVIKEGDFLAGRYRVEGILGSGVFAKVIKATDIITNQLTCLKMISNNKDFFDQALDEIKLLRYISSNVDPDKYNLLKIKGVFYHREHLFIQTDLLKDNLFVAYRKNPAFFSLPVLREIAKQIIVSLTALHGLHVIHADLKPENILIKSYNPIKIKVVDLGNSCFFHDHLGEYVQSRSYRAPQVILGIPYDQKIDLWSLGCILAQLWTKNVLFYNIHVQGMLARIQSIVGPWPEWMLDQGQSVQNYFSKQNLIFFEEDAKFHILIPKITSLKVRIRIQDDNFLNFLEGTLKIDPNFRLSAEQALDHQWICE